MRIPKLLLPALLIAAVIAGCDNQTTEPEVSTVFKGVDDEHFYQEWTRSPEDEIGLENPSDQVYRSSESKEAFSGPFLMQYSFERDGTCKWLVRGSSGMHFRENGTWKVEPENLNVVSIDNPVGIEVAQFRVLEVNVDNMRIESIKYQIPPCNYRYGVLDTWFVVDATLDQVEAFCQDLGLGYTYFNLGPVRAKIEVLEGEVAALIAQIEADEAVAGVTYSEVRDPAPHDILYISFVPHLTVEAASDFLATIPGIEVESIGKTNVEVRFEVTPGSEDDWIEVIGQQSLVSSCRKVNEDRSPECEGSSR